MLPWTEIVIIIKWYSVLFLIGFIGWTLILPIVKNFPASGFGAGKAAGLIILGSLSWIFSSIHFLPFTKWSLWLWICIGIFFVFIKRKELLSALKTNLRQIIIIELCCLILFTGLIFIKALKPGITDIEKYMDSAFLNAVMRTEYAPPIDPWYGDSPINYYYLGHWFLACIAKLTSIPGQYAFNLGFATVIALAGTNILTAGWALSKKFWGGLLATLLTLFTPNLHPFIEHLESTQNYFFFNSGRFINEVINEYPLQSILIGDLHAHMISLILATSCILVALALFLNKNNSKILVKIFGFLLGLMYATNAFDIINFGIFISICVLSYWYLNTEKKITLLLNYLFFGILGAALPVLLYNLNFAQPTGGIGLSWWKTPTLHIFWQFGLPLLIILISLIILIFRYLILNKPNADLANKLDYTKNTIKNHALLFCIIISGILLVLLPQVIFVKDIYFYQNPPYFRANTVFKIWYEAWILLSLAAGVLITLIPKKYSFTILILCLYVSSFGLKSGKEMLLSSVPLDSNNQKYYTIDGINYIKKIQPQIYSYEAVEWAKNNIKGQPLVLEATGQSYTTYDWFSAFTGLPTIIGWQSHEWGWRYSKDRWNIIAERMGAVERFYKAQSSESLQSISKQFKISYVLVSQNEKLLYGENPNIEKTFGPAVFTSSDGGTKIYKTF